MTVSSSAEVKIGTPGTWYRNVSDYDVSEDSTPLAPGDDTGGFGQIQVTVPTVPGLIGQMNKELSLTDGSLGETVGIIRDISGDPLATSFTASSRLGLLAVERRVLPFVGTLGDGLEYLLGLCGITSGIEIDDALYLMNVKLIGGMDNVYDRIKRICAAYDIEASLVSNNVVFRQPRQRTAVNYRDADISWKFDQSNLARAVQGYYYECTSGTDIAYPLHGITADAQVWQVDANETLVFEVPLDASLTDVIQPTCVSTVAIDDMSASVYSVCNAEGGSVTPAGWLGAGGSLTVEVGEDTKTLIVTVVGANRRDLAPFRIAVSTGENQYYSSLRVRGNGIFWTRGLMTMEMGTDPDIATDEVGVVVDNEFMESRDRLHHRILRTMARHSTDRQTIHVTSGGINRLGESGSARYPTIGTVDTLFPGATIGSIETQLGPTIADWNAELFDYVRADFANQAFGNVNGARVLHEGSYYRIRSASTKTRVLEYTAERDNTIADVYDTGETIGQWNTRWAGKKIRDVNIAPIAQ